ncbi:MAG: primosomal protein N' [Clostridia bacterium]|nr:primosomal protein N' [Clostridia bacterium]MDR3643838.1 primosomal protein N' [Clostridia bacterium]
MKLALVAVEGAAFHYDKPFTYLVPSELEPDAVPGVRVKVPFGAGGRQRQGIILGLCEDAGQNGLKPLASVLDQHPLIADELLGLAYWMKEHCYCTLYEALKPMMPAGIGMRLIKEYILNPDFNDEEACLLDPDAQQAIALLRKRRAPLERSRLLTLLGLSADSTLPDSLAARGILMQSDAVSTKNAEATMTMLRLTQQSDDELQEETKLTPKQRRVTEVLGEYGSASLKEICYFAGVTAGVVRTLVKKGLLEQYEKRIFRNPYHNLAAGGAPELILSPCQQEAYESLAAKYRAGGACATLLFGVTGSGKTSVFMKLISDVLADGRGVIVLVPEISLTPQAVERFVSRFGAQVAVLHSGLSLGERLDEWQRVHDGSARIVVGTRSAVFAPVERLGLVIIDEEQEHTYKSEMSPRYHARDIARYRCAKAGAMMLLASATPSVESFYAAKTGRYGLLRLDERYGGAVLPEVIVVDMKQELQNGSTSPVSSRLLQEIDENLQGGLQSILLLNRRGYNTYVSCAECGAVLTCPHCSIALTYHSANGRLMCHYCGYSADPRAKCPQCGSKHLRYSGSGTQRIEEEIAQQLPQAALLRMDMDTTLAKFSHEKILARFAKGDCDVLIGTQMVAKGLDFPKVTLVGVLSVDGMLYMNDFRASERTFALLTQVIGRAGRGSLKGRAVIQTQTPENSVLRLAALQDYDAFYGQEIELRRLLLYPPFCELCEICFSGISEPEVAGASGEFAKMLAQAQKETKRLPLRVLGPSAAGVARAGGRYRYKILIKCRESKPLRELIAALLVRYGKSKHARRVAAFVDMNPLTIL